MNTDFNLLNHPVHARQRRWRWRAWTFLVGTFMGLLAGAWAMHRLQVERDALVFEQDRLQVELQQKRAQMGQHQIQQAALAKAEAQHRLLLQVQHHQQAWRRLFLAAGQEHGPVGWTIERLQVEGDRLELQGRIREVQALAEAQSRWSQALQSPVSLVSLVASPTDLKDRSAGEHVFVWQGPWPALPALTSSRVP